ncbi:hypothetical protein EJ06DRAFT_567325 [Trichodelitschia bisporula]|uniref:Uncharacterized protein n=1 Tax=Trichodelitschia bisporula TaxID=703511 RepID=A0A6G1HL12_9PEZI|nr:hypothetical protein EJ06DRAFT_567325 [Trichodelitschia bisporula]
MLFFTVLHVLALAAQAFAFRSANDAAQLYVRVFDTLSASFANASFHNATKLSARQAPAHVCDTDNDVEPTSSAAPPVGLSGAPQWASDDAWKEAKCKGERLCNLMRAAKDEATAILKADSESSFQNPADNPFKSSGWRVLETYSTTRLSQYRISAALSSIGVPEEAGKGTSNRQVIAVQDRPYTVDGNEYPYTSATFSNVYNVDALFLGATANFGVQHQMAHRPHLKDNPAPALNRWSDVVFTIWDGFMGGQPGPIKAPRYVMRIDLQNLETKQLVNKALSMLVCDPPLTEEEKASWPAWPGVSFSTEHTKGKALLNAPNAIGVAWLLINHKVRFGRKTITEITIFSAGTPGQEKKFILLKIEDA